MKKQNKPARRQLPPIALDHIPRRIRRQMARANMTRMGLRHTNDRDRLLGKSYFALHWKDWVIGVPRRKAV